MSQAAVSRNAASAGRAPDLDEPAPVAVLASEDWIRSCDLGLRRHCERLVCRALSLFLSSPGYARGAKGLRGLVTVFYCRTNVHCFTAKRIRQCKERRQRERETAHTLESSCETLGKGDSRDCF